jgi:hypothetical protein
MESAEMETHETDVPVWSRDNDDTSASRARHAAPPGEADADPVMVPEEDVVVIESNDTSDYQDSAAAADHAEPAGTAWSAGPAEAASLQTSAGEDSMAEPIASQTAAPTADTERWSEVKAMFVDDPGESVRLASALVERAIENLMTSLRQHQESLRSWEADDSAGTEELRNALRGYRGLFEELDGMAGQLRSGRARVSDGA